MAILLTDADLPRCLSMQEAIETIEGALRERRESTAVSPPRTHWPIADTGFTITPGGFRRLEVLGFRAYLLGGGARDQLTAVWRLPDRSLQGLVVGSSLGALRTGAIGGVAYKFLAPTDTAHVAVVGGGLQSRTQLLALQAVRPSIRSVRLYRRDGGRRRTSAARLADELHIPVEPVDSAEAAIRDADVVILATGSNEPVLQSTWLKRGAHVSSLGPKYQGRSEIGLDTLQWADWIACDFPEQYRREEDFLLHGSPREAEIRDLATVAAGPLERAPDRNTLFLSHGLAGTEVAVAYRALANAHARGIGVQIPALDRDLG
jgi:ornithine cyclodeaminase/alanine dehydrogenase-like protein (mu-crystallin family)